MDELRDMLAVKVDRGALWGPTGFPYRCGVTEADFTLWALAPEEGYRVNASLRSARTVGTMLKRFCADCPMKQRMKATDEGTCIAPVLEEYRGGGRPKTRHREVIAAAAEGATLAELEQQTGYSRRNLFRILKKPTRSGVAR